MQALLLPEPTGVAKSSKYRVRKWAVIYAHFGVPLHAERELRGRLDGNGLDEAIRRLRLNAQTSAQPLDPLMMQRVDHCRCLIRELRESPARDDVDRVAVFVPVLQRPVMVAFTVVKATGLIMDSALQRAAKRDIEFLKSATDAKKRYFRLEDFWQQR